MENNKLTRLVEFIRKAKDRSQFRPELLSLAALQPYPEFISSSREVMFMGHAGQSLVVAGTEPRLVTTGAERLLGKFTFNKKVPSDSEVYAVIPRFSNTAGGTVKGNNNCLVIFKSDKPGRYEAVEMQSFFSLHQHFGFAYRHTAEFAKVTTGKPFRKGTVLADSPALTENGDYGYGVNAVVAMMTVPGIIEDGLVVRRGYLEKLKTKGYGRRVINFGNKKYPLNLYGKDGKYKYIPEIGERVGPDGLLYAARTKDPLMDAINMHPERLKHVDFFADETIYAEPNAKIVDIIVHHCPGTKEKTPLGMGDQAKAYWNAEQIYHNAIHKMYDGLQRTHRKSLELSPLLNRIVCEAMGRQSTRTDNRNKKVRTLNKTYRMQALDEYRIEVVFEYDIVPDEGFKLTGCHGDKGVICEIWEDEDMPTDGHLVTDIIACPLSTSNRLNVSRDIEHYMGAASVTHHRRVKDFVAKGDYDTAYKILEDFYRIISPPQLASTQVPGFNRKAHVDFVCSRPWIDIWTPTNNPKDPINAIEELQAKYPPLNGPVSYKAPSAERTVTKVPVMLGISYYMALEKIGNDWSGVSSAKLQVHGLPAKLTALDRYSTPGRPQPVRLLGETEIRLISAACGALLSAELADQSTNPTTHKHIQENILLSKTPSNMDTVVDRVAHPLGNARPQKNYAHMAASAGFQFTRGE